MSCCKGMRICTEIGIPYRGPKGASDQCVGTTILYDFLTSLQEPRMKWEVSIKYIHAYFYVVALGVNTAPSCRRLPPFRRNLRPVFGADVNIGTTFFFKTLIITRETNGCNLKMPTFNLPFCENIRSHFTVL